MTAETPGPETWLAFQFQRRKGSGRRPASSAAWFWALLAAAVLVGAAIW